VEELKLQPQPKRARTDDDDGDDHELFTEADNWDLSVHLQWVTRVQNLARINRNLVQTLTVFCITPVEKRVADIVARKG
jgi:hypothetical protein